MAMAMALLVTLVTSVSAVMVEVDVTVEEEGPSLGPGADSSDPFLETQQVGDHYLLRGHGHEGEYRVLDADLATVTVLPPPEDGFLIKGCTFSDWGLRFLMWGRGQGDANDTLHLYDVDQGVFDDSVLTNATVPLVTIDHARLLASEVMLLVAGRDANGTSRAILRETLGNSTRNQLDVPGNRTIIHSDVNGNFLPVIDEAGGMLIIESNNWSLKDSFDPPVHVPTFYEIHDQRFWTIALENGTVRIGGNIDNEVLYEYLVHEGPLEGAVYGKLENGALFVITARAADGGGSTLEVWWAGRGDWQRIHEMHLEKGVAFLHHVPGEDLLFLVGHEDGSVVQYSIDIQDIPPKPKQPFYMEGKYMVPLLLAVVVILVAWWFLTKRVSGGDERGQ